MDRILVYAGEIPLDEHLLNTNRFAMRGLGESLKATLGTGTTCDGLAVTATTPASLAVLVAPGAIYSLQNLDGSGYGSLAADTAHQTVKQGLLKDAVTLATPAPGTAGQSVIYLIQAVYSDQDTDPVVLPYYNDSNPTQAYSGPNNSGTSQNTFRRGVCVVSAKAGVSAVSPSAPAPDAGYVGLYTVQVANGQSTVTAANITLLATAPFLAVKLPGLQVLGTRPLSNTTGGISLVRAYAGNPNGNLAGNAAAGSAPPDFAFDTLAAALYVCTATGNAGAAVWSRVASGRTQLTANRTYYVRTDGSDSNDGLSNTAGGAFANWQKGADAASKLDRNGYDVTVQIADGTYTAPVRVSSPFTGQGDFKILGNLANPSNVILSTTGTDALGFVKGAKGSIGGFKVQTTTSGGGIFTQDPGSAIDIVGQVVFGPIFGGSTGPALSASAATRIAVLANLTFAGGAGIGINANKGTIEFGNVTVTMTGTPNFSNTFAAAGNNGTIVIQSVTFSGAANGKRYNADTAGGINTGGQGASYLPGSTAGTLTSPGYYV